MRRYGERLAGDARYVVPALEEALTTRRVLAMDFVEGRAIETLADAPQEVRDRRWRALIELVLRELFDFGVMQTDPNFANYRWQPETGRLVLLDFGATRAVPAATADGYRALIEAGLARDLRAVRDVAVETGFLGAAAAEAHRPAIDRMIAAIDAALNRPGPFDFGDRAFVPVLREEAKAMIADRETWHVPDVETLFVQRKVSGTALLAARLKAKVDVRGLAAAAVGGESDPPPPGGGGRRSLTEGGRNERGRRRVLPLRRLRRHPPLSGGGSIRSASAPARCRRGSGCA